MVDRLKKIVLSVAVLSAFFLYSWHERQEQAQLPTVSRHQNISEVKTPSSSSAPPPDILTGKYKDGTYTGDVTDAFYGNIQVSAVISGGRLSDVVFLQYPNDRQTSIRISTESMPILKQEAIEAQEADVDIVSGATDTSIAFRKSLKSALDKAAL
ncbi:MAG: FMN-binding protein [Candidatus Levybacteria bacterium]|nr:FMN-binding protein [Candidatus Levybacteria bacterium]